METLLMTLGVFVAAAVLLPFVFYLSTKLVVYAFYRGRHLHNEEMSYGCEEEEEGSAGAPAGRIDQA